MEHNDQAGAHRFLLDRDPRKAFEASLAADLDLLACPTAPASRLEPQAAWAIPAADLTALRRWGVPIVPDPRPQQRVQLAGEVQNEADPRILTGSGERAYLLGTYWRMRVGAVEKVGTVIGVRTDEDAASFGNSVVYINSSVAAFIEIAWRWAYASSALRNLSAHDYDYLYDGLDEFRALVHRLDPATDPESTASGSGEVGSEPGAAPPDHKFPFWDGIIEGW